MNNADALRKQYNFKMYQELSVKYIGLLQAFHKLEALMQSNAYSLSYVPHFPEMWRSHIF